jgi:single-strand DNA-binding protein
MNIVAVIGNVAAAPDLRYTPGGRAVCSFRLAVSRPGGEQADFFSVVAWERQAEVCAQYLTVGKRVGVDGRLHHTSWEHEGVRRSRVEIVAHRVQMLGSPPVAQSDTLSPEEPCAATPDDTEQLAVT